MLSVVSGASATMPGSAVAQQTASSAQLWHAPADISSRDLFYGPGGPALAPDPAARYEFVERDRFGHSDGYEVRALGGALWSVKVGDEAQAEVVSSRILWAIGFHQPPTYYVTKWTLSGREAGPKPAARFRPHQTSLKRVGDWDWYKNPFVGTRPFHALLVANLFVNNWDWKPTNNKIYDLDTETEGARRWYVVRDLGASLGRTRFPSFLFTLLPFYPFGTRNDLPGFESQDLVKGIRDGIVDFDYHGRHLALLRPISAADVRWACELLSKITARQWQDAFRAAGYSADKSRRYIAKMRAKIDQGLRLRSD